MWVYGQCLLLLRRQFLYSACEGEGTTIKIMTILDKNYFSFTPCSLGLHIQAFPKNIKLKNIPTTTQ